MGNRPPESLFCFFSLLKDRTILAQAMKIPPKDIALILGILGVYCVLHAQRFVLLIEQYCRCRLPLLAWIKMLIAMRFMNDLVPQMGSVYRGIALKGDSGVSYTE